MLQTPEKRVFLGVDFGASTTRIALLNPVKPMPTIVRNDLSNEATSTIVSYPINEARCIGEAAFSKQITRVKETVVDLAQWLFGWSTGFVPDGTSTSQRTAESSEGTLCARVIGETEFHPAQVAGYYIKCILGFVPGGYTGQYPVCLSVPPALSAPAVVALHQACFLSGIPKSQTILAPRDEAVAVYFHHMQYGNLDEKTPSHVVFVDVGHASSSACVFSVTKNTIEKVGVHSINIGSSFIDASLCEYIVNEIEKKHPQCQLSGDVKTCRRILRECKKLKETLSTIDETKIQLEGLKNDTDFVLPITRSFVEQRSIPFTEALQGMLQEVKKIIPSPAQADEEQESNTVAEPRVEVIGGGWRFPCISDLIKRELGVSRLGVSLDAVMAIAEGSAILAELRTHVALSSGSVDEKCESKDNEEVGEPQQAQETKESAVRASDRHPVHQVSLLNFSDGGNDLKQFSAEEEAAVERWAAIEAKLSATDALIHERLDAINQLDTYVLQTLDAVDHCDADNTTKDAARSYLYGIDDYVRSECNNDDKDIIHAKLVEVKAHIEEKHPEIEKYYEKVRVEAKRKEEELIKLSQQQKEEDEDLKSDPQRLRVAQKRREQGQNLFKQECWQEAQTRFVQALAILGQLYDTSSEENKTKKNEISLSCHLNIASCSVKLGLWRNVINNCTNALELSPNHPKALFRRGQAYLSMKDFDAAVKDLEMARELSKDDPAVVAELTRAKKSLGAQKAQEKRMFAKMFS
ncbi:unnamed protein product [Phytomonas sp. EM1]|nr:unnamed protein product [Phytomonas sp. EM1]|eukprot:CCW59637.1 unnamed protein product [Phytomonas sp. isolate EM1]